MKLLRGLPVLAVLLVAACAPQATAPVVNAPPVTRPRAERMQDDALGRAVLGKLRQTDAKAFGNVSVLAWDGAVSLAGAVTKPESRRRAVALAKEAGALAVFDDLMLDENPANPAFVADVAREQKIYAALLGQSDITGAYTVRVVNGVAILLGTSRAQEDSERASAFVCEAEGVKWVVNHVVVRAASPKSASP
jgi:osmotically-inducible protein OsmY